MPKIEIISGPQEGLSFSLNESKTQYVIGRNPTNEIVLVDMNASRRHARIIHSPEEGFYVEDMNSSNGTYVNGFPIKDPVKLEQNLQVRIGTTVFRFDESETIFSGTSESPGSEMEDFGQSFVQMLEQDSSGSMDHVLDEDEEMEDVQEVQDTDTAKQAHVKLKTLYKVSEDIGTVLELSEVLEKIMDSIFEVFPQIDRGFIMLADPETGEMEPEVIRKRGAEDGEQIKVSVSRTIIETAFREKKSILSSDAMDDDRFSEGMSIVNFEIRSMMCTPLFVGDEKLGVIHVDTMEQGERFTPDDLSLLQGIGRQAAISIKNAKLVDEIEEETKRRNSLQRFLSPDIADRVITGEIDLKLGGDEKYGTVFFSDIIGFTRMSSLLEPEVVVAKINRYFNRMVSIIFNYNGTVNKFGGDSIMALWGLTSEHGDHTPQVSSVEASIDMQNTLFDFNYALIEGGQKPIQMGVGLNTGEFLAGNVGSQQQMEYTVIGSAVNLASRIETKAARGQIYISEPTYQRIKNRIYGIKMDPTMVKGHDEPLQIYSVRGFLDRDFNDRDKDRLTIPVSFRDSEGRKHNGLMREFWQEGDVKFVSVHFRERFNPEDKLQLELDLPEIAEPGSLVCSVKEIQTVEAEEDTVFFDYGLQVDSSSECFDSLLNDKVIKATVDVDDIKRE